MSATQARPKLSLAIPGDDALPHHGEPERSTPVATSPRSRAGPQLTGRSASKITFGRMAGGAAVRSSSYSLNEMDALASSRLGGSGRFVARAPQTPAGPSRRRAPQSRATSPLERPGMDEATCDRSSTDHPRTEAEEEPMLHNLRERARRLQALIANNAARLLAQRHQLETLELRASEAEAALQSTRASHAQQLATVREGLQGVEAKLAGRRCNAARYAEGLESMRADAAHLRRVMASNFVAKCERAEYCLPPAVVQEANVPCASAPPSQMDDNPLELVLHSGSGGTKVGSSSPPSPSSQRRDELLSTLLSTRSAVTVDPIATSRLADAMNVVDLQEQHDRVRLRASLPPGHSIFVRPRAESAQLWYISKSGEADARTRQSFLTVNRLQGVHAGNVPWIEGAAARALLHHHAAAFDEVVFDWCAEIVGEKKQQFRDTDVLSPGCQRFPLDTDL